MSPQFGFLTSFVLTLVALAIVVITGFRARRKVHLCSVLLALVLLSVTIYFAERMGEHYDLESAGRIYPVHLTLAKLAALSYLLPLVSGLITLRKAGFRPWHRRCAFLTIALTVAAAITGTMMVLSAEPIHGASQTLSE